ncbi:hypothetical protein CEXT_70931 [Caerostris extrusa]|uniref:Uncharacterized protein n=1 Tax=Caerostris extrusa TaxID=172846 RepID=A0AAV4MWN1_CAEEX|nr:hypothetical protein CEXT_70931 [Caerostris extrusa]
MIRTRWFCRNFAAIRLLTEEFIDSPTTDCHADRKRTIPLTPEENKDLARKAMAGGITLESPFMGKMHAERKKEEEKEKSLLEGLVLWLSIKEPEHNMTKSLETEECSELDDFA